MASTRIVRIAVAHFQSISRPGKALCGEPVTKLVPCPTCQRVLESKLRVHIADPSVLADGRLRSYCGALLSDDIDKRWVSHERAAEVAAFAEANPDVIEPCFCDTCATKADRAIDDEARGWANLSNPVS